MLDSDFRVCTPAEQEVHFFDREEDLTFEAYCRIFPNCSGDAASADVTPDYMDSPDILPALKDIEAAYGFQPKIVVILREPVQRAFSAYQMFLNYGKSLGDFTKNLELGNDIFEKSQYGKHLQRWLEAGYGSRMHIILFDDVVDNPREVLQSLSSFMGLDSLLSDAYVASFG